MFYCLKNMENLEKTAKSGLMQFLEGDLDSAEKTLLQVYSNCQKMLDDKPSEELSRLSSGVEYCLSMLFTRRAELSAEKSDFNDTLKFSDRALFYISINDEALFYKGLAQGQLGQDQDALKTVDILLSACKNGVNRANTLGETFTKMSKSTLALNIYEKIIAKYPNNVRALFGCALNHYDARRLHTAIGYYNQIIALNSTIPDAYQMRGLSYFLLYEYKKAIPDFELAIQKMLEDSPSPEDLEACGHMRIFIDWAKNPPI